MKNILYPLLTLLIISCGSKETTVEDAIASNDLKVIREKKNEISTKYENLRNELEKLEKAIAKIDPNKKIPLVTAYTVKDTTFNHFVEIQGSVQTRENLVLTPEYSGLLSRIYVKEGQYVNKGQTLARIDDGGLSQQLSQLEIQAQLAKTTFERQERLWNQKIGSEIQYLQAKSGYETQQAAVNQLKSNLAKTTIRAPFSGVIDEIITEQGSVVAPGQTPILRIVSLKNMYVEASVPERYIGSITKGTSVDVTIPVIGKTITAKVKQTSSYINPSNRTYMIEVPVPNKEKNIKPNLTARLRINDYTSDDALLIPQNLISENAEGEQYVYVIENKNGKQIAAQKTISTGKIQNNLVEITEGITANSKIVQEGARSVKNNQEVKILN